MKNILINKKWLYNIALLLLVISLSSCSGEINEFEDIFTDTLFPFISVFSLALIFYMIVSSFFGVSPEHKIFNLDGKTHWLTTYKSIIPSSLRESLEEGEWAFVFTFPMILGVIIYGVVILMTGKINIFLELFIFIVCQYASYKLCFKMQKCMTILYYSLIILLALGFVGAILYIIYFIGESEGY